MGIASRITAFLFIILRLSLSETQASAASTSFSGTPFSIPGGFNAVDYNRGGEGSAYHDYDVSNNGGAYRQDGIDIRTTSDAGGGFAIGYSVAGEFIEYSINVTRSGTYSLLTRMSAPQAGRTFHIEIDGLNVTGSVPIPQTWSYENFVNISTDSFALQAGFHTMRFVAETGDSDLRWFQINYTGELTTPVPILPPVVQAPIPVPAPVAPLPATGAVSLPFSGTPFSIPGGFNAVDYNRGGEGVAYHDYDISNNGGAYRQDGIDIRTTVDAGGGFAIGYSVAGEFIEYSINVTRSGMYGLLTRMSAPLSGRTFSIEVDGLNVTGSVQIPQTWSYDSFKDIAVPAFSLSQGDHVMRFVAETGDADLSWFQLNFISASALPPVVVQPPSPAVVTPQPPSTTPPTVSGYQLVEDFTGADFFSHFDFNTFPDPTHGYVNYVDQTTAASSGLISINSSGSAVIRVDSTSFGSGIGRAAVRLSSKSAYGSGLFVIDVAHMPEGMGVWPAFWTFGPNWPSSGEIDIIEGVNNNPRNAQTLHTSPGCTMNQVNAPATMTGVYNGSRDCNSNNAYNGCSTEGDADSFGPGFNNKGGGVFAMLWHDTKIQVYFWPRARVPANITNDNRPDPATWGLPVANFELGASCPANYFQNHNLIINTTFCGDWAGNVFPGGMQACIDYVRNNPSAFTKAYWEINSLRTYKQSRVP